MNLPTDRCNHPLQRGEPTGYVEWLDWAERMNLRGWVQHRCPVCRLWKIWVKPKKEKKNG